MFSKLEVLYEDDQLVAIRKPHGLLVHRTPIAADASVFAIQLLREQLGRRVYPVHRLDRKTEGVLLFAKEKQVNAALQALFRKRLVKKKYHAIVRGFTEDVFEIDYRLKLGTRFQEAITTGKTLRRFEVCWPSGGFSTSRYALVELCPLTGRHHQLRRHMAHIRHPIIGDRPHGCNKQNRLWKERFGMVSMFLIASGLSLEYPLGRKIDISCTPSVAFSNAIGVLERALLNR